MSEIGGALAGERIDRVVALLCACTRSQAAELIARGAVRIDGAIATKGSLRVEAGARVEIDAEVVPAPLGIVGDESVDVAVVHEDVDFLVVDKPAGLVVHPGSGNAHRTLVNGLLARYPEIASVGEPERPGIVHRIDKDTSGLLLVARTPVGFASLTAQIRAHTVTRRYLALVWGHFDAPTGLVDAPIGRSAREPTRMTVSTTGRDARTSYAVIAEYVDPAPVSLVQCTLETGRTHQIRVHLQTIGHPVVGDRRYGGVREPFGHLPRFFLHAEHLELDHPRTGKRLAFDSPLPADLAAVLSRLTASPARRAPSPPHRRG